MADSEGKSFIASGNINVASFVKVGSTDDFIAAQAGVGDNIYGISQQFPFDPPGISGSTAYAATTGQSLLVYHQGDVCLLVAGTAGYSAGDRLKADANGYGVTATTGDHYGAIALQTAAAGTWGRVEVAVGTL